LKYFIFDLVILLFFVALGTLALEGFAPLVNAARAKLIDCQHRGDEIVCTNGQEFQFSCAGKDRKKFSPGFDSRGKG